jgi:hypothetical protein
MYHTNVTEMTDIKIKMDTEEHIQVIKFMPICISNEYVFVSLHQLFNQGPNFTKLCILVWVL